MDSADNIGIVRLDCGNCAACSTKALLREGLCRKCHVEFKDWGPGGWQSKYAPILQRCRENKMFALVLYSRLKNELARDKFAKSFGPFPELALVSDSNA
jgi:hypothetical protein